MLPMFFIACLEEEHVLMIFDAFDYVGSMRRFMSATYKIQVDSTSSFLSLSEPFMQ